MDKKMRELLAKIEEKQTAAKGFLESKDTEKAQACMKEIDDLQKQYEIAEKLFKAEQSKVPDNSAEEEKKTDGFNVISKMLRKKSLTETEKALITGTNAANGEGYLIPEDVDLAIRELRKTYVSAKDIVSVIPTDTLSGSFNFESGTPAGLTALTDGGDIDTTGDPTFARKAFAIGLYAKLIPISNVLKGVEKAGLMSYINRWFIRNAIISENAAIFAALKKDKTPKALVGWKQLKSSINKDLDPSALIDGVIVTNQTGFDVLDSELDGQGRPILTNDISNPTVKRFNGLPIKVFPDAQLANVSGKAPIFYGSLNAGAYFIEKGGLEFAVSEDYLFGKNQTALRVIEGFDVIQADTDAYIYGTISATV